MFQGLMNNPVYNVRARDGEICTYGLYCVMCDFYTKWCF